ncbi:DUF4401 domain-containing protein [Desulfopila sp. IMCC35008]|uniref:DUF4401 domain-containing protein n=1 Tax=Desulfopila sp. IMCC35008 TaxID=2653858 RepID=UPI0013D32B3E|nr:DUF4401 domain-containing protein [Desulfopila sp. IMCC35008]
MSKQRDGMWATLLQAGLVKGELPDANNLDSPWYAKLLLAFSGWLAALFLLCFIGAVLFFMVENAVASIISAGMMIGGAYALLRISKNEFFEHLALALSLAGQALLVWGIFKITNEFDEKFWLPVACVQLFLAAFIPSFTHRVFSSWLACIAFSITLAFFGIPYIMGSIVMFLAAWCWFNELKYPSYISELQAIGYGLVLAQIQQKGALVYDRMAMDWLNENGSAEIWTQPWMGEILSVVVLVYVVLRLLQHGGQALTSSFSITALLGTFLLGFVSIEAQGITSGMVIILLGFSRSNRVLLGLGIASLLFNISAYYYLLERSLLVKALTLLIIGLVLLAIRFFVLRMMPVEKEVYRV